MSILLPAQKRTRRSGQTSPFYLLPKELRLKIWRLTIQPRHVVLWNATQDSKYFYFKNTPYPVALHACTESRSELLRQYTRIKLSQEASGDTRPRRCKERHNIYSSNATRHYINYINFSVDTVVFPNDDRLLRASEALLDKFQLIQSIVICSDIYGEIRSQTAQMLRDMPNLRAIYILVSGISDTLGLYDPSTQYKLSLRRAPPDYSWGLLLASYRRLIAKYWGERQVPVNGLVAYQRPSPDCVVPGPDTLYCGEYRDWMVDSYR